MSRLQEITFLESLCPPSTAYTDIFEKLFQGVISTNKMIGMDYDNMNSEENESICANYEKLCIEEGKEIIGAVKNKDKVELVGELVDYLVVGYFFLHLYTGCTELYDNHNLYLGEDINETYDAFVSLYTMGDYLDAIPLVETMLCDMDVDLERVVDTVLEANLSKFPTLELLYEAGFVQAPDVISRQISVLEGGDRYGGVTCKKVIGPTGAEHLTFWSKTEYGKPKVKYLKPITTIKPNYAACWLR